MKKHKASKWIGVARVLALLFMLIKISSNFINKENFISISIILSCKDISS